MMTSKGGFLAVVAVAMIGLVGCQEEEPGLVIGGSVDCDLTNETLDGTTWVMSEAMPDRSSRPNPKARIRFRKEDGEMKADYSVGSVANMYSYDCAMRGEEWLCTEPVRVLSWCGALEVHEQGSCTPERLQELGATGVSAEEMTKEIAEARTAVDAARAEGGQAWERFKLENNNLGNKLQGLLYAKVNTRKCDLRVTDMYMTLYNGERKEDSNPVGTNPFERTEDPLLWENCEDGNLADHTSETLPEDISTMRRGNEYGAGTPVHYHYVGDRMVQAKEGCTYAYDLYAQWRPVEQGVAVTPGEEGALAWHAAHTWTEPSDAMDPRSTVHMVRTETCSGAEPVVEAACSVVRVN